MPTITRAPRAPRLRAFLRSSLVLPALLFVSSALAQVNLSASYSGDTVTFTGDHNIRYLADYATNTLVLPGSVLTDKQTPFPAGYRVILEQEGVKVEVGQPFRVTLSSSERVLTLVRGETLGSVPEQIAGDARAPVMYRLANAEPSQVASHLKSLYDLPVEVDTRQRALLVMVNPQDRVLVDELVAALDEARPQVMFEAEIVEINQSVTQSLGINYDSIFSFTLAEGEVPSVFGTGPFSRNGLSLTLGLNLLKTNGAAKTLARPRVTTLDGVQANINATQSFPVVVESSNGQESVQNITTGIQLSMTPKISPDGQVEAELNISVSTPTGITSQKVPTFSSREASTTVRVANGEPIAIGGLYEKRTLKGVSKVPILGDIPILGALFTSTSTEERETDLVIVVTPRIVDMPNLQTVRPGAAPVVASVPEGEETQEVDIETSTSLAAPLAPVAEEGELQ